MTEILSEFVSHPSNVASFVLVHDIRNICIKIRNPNKDVSKERQETRHGHERPNIILRNSYIMGCFSLHIISWNFCNC